jgi:hypothetical protein
LEPQPRGSSPLLLNIHTELQQYAASIESPQEAVNVASQTRDSVHTLVPPLPSRRLRIGRRRDLCSQTCVRRHALLHGLQRRCVARHSHLRHHRAFHRSQPNWSDEAETALPFLRDSRWGASLRLQPSRCYSPTWIPLLRSFSSFASVAFIAGWVLRSPHISSVGTQIGFAFFLTTLQGFSATTQIATARDRIIGVTLGIVVMRFIFDQLWPTHTSDELSQILRRIRDAAVQLHPN